MKIPAALWLGLAMATGLVAACAGPPQRPTQWTPHDCLQAAQERSARATIRALAVAESAARVEALQCQDIAFGLVACPTEIQLEEWAWRHHSREPTEEDLEAPLDPPDPLPIRDGLDIYEEILRGVTRRTRAHMDLWEHTPALNEADIEYFRDHPEVWQATVTYRSAPPGRQRMERLEEAWNRIDSREGRRHLLLRNGYLYFEDPVTADWVARQTRLRDLFDAPELELTRGARTYRLERGHYGRYYYTDPELDGYRARLLILDRVGAVGELPVAPSYNLDQLRRRFGIAHIEVGYETGAGRTGEVAFLDGSRLPARLLRAERGIALLGVMGSTSTLNSTLQRSRTQAEVIYGLIEMTEQMVRENLFFDEPANEVGQQDGIMRLAFMDAYELGMQTYKVNMVEYSIYDELGRPRPPQVCVDYLTDALERYTGTWWPDITQEATQRTRGRIHIRRYMRYRQVRQLVKLAEENPWIALLLSFGPAEQIPFRDQSAFFQNIWNHRDQFRIGDMFVIYGLKADGRYHYHSFYVHDTDPIHGVPIVLTDQAGHARIRSWNDVMSNAPLRSIRHRVRWNPDWVLHPQAVDLAGSVIRQSRALLTPPEPAQESTGEDAVTSRIDLSEENEKGEAPPTEERRP